MLERLKQWLRRLRTRLVVLWLCSKHPRMPFAAKLIAVALVAYAVSPIDLIPDFIPVLGYLDDLLILPIGIWIVWRMIPPDLIAQCEADAAGRKDMGSTGRWGTAAAVVTVVLWIALAVWAWQWWNAAE